MKYIKNAYSSLCKLNIFIFIKVQTWFSQEQSEIFSLLLFDYHEWQIAGLLGEVGEVGEAFEQQKWTAVCKCFVFFSH